MMSDRRPNNQGLLVGRVVDYDARTEMVSLKLARDLAVGDQLDFWVKVGGRVSAEIEHLYDEEGRECPAASAGILSPSGSVDVYVCMTEPSRSMMQN